MGTAVSPKAQRFESTAQKAKKILISLRTTPLDQVEKPSQGLSLFYTDLDKPQVKVSEIAKMGKGAVDSNSLYVDGGRIPGSDLVGEEGYGFKLMMYGMNAERILLAGEGLGLVLQRYVVQPTTRRNALSLVAQLAKTGGYSTRLQIADKSGGSTSDD